MPVRDIWFWQTMVTPHMAGLACALACVGCKVTYVAGQPMSEDRRALGWTVASLRGVELRFAGDRSAIDVAIRDAGADSIHICQGMRANDAVGIAQARLAARGFQQWVVMESVDDRRWKGPAKRATYSWLAKAYSRRVRGILATGYRTTDWLIQRGWLSSRVFPFAYFLDAGARDGVQMAPRPGAYRVVFVGQFVELKRLPLLVDALARIPDRSVELAVVGSGPLERPWRAYAEARLSGRVRWLGRLPMGDVPRLLIQADCLVLPSACDGWGAVVSEALIVGTPAFCSDACGSAGVVRASGVGGVFHGGDAVELAGMIAAAVEAGRLSDSERSRLAGWAADTISAAAGARYLLRILDHADGSAPRPQAPWEAMEQPCAA